MQHIYIPNQAFRVAKLFFLIHECCGHVTLSSNFSGTHRPTYKGHSISNHPMPYTAPTQILLNLHTYSPCDPNRIIRRNPFF